MVAGRTGAGSGIVVTAGAVGSLGELDAAYVPFADVAAWADSAVDAEVWDEYVGALDIRRTASDEAARQRAAEVAMRAAAFDTGALEGLYDTTRGVTLTIATMSAAWTSELQARGPDTRRQFEAQLAGYEMALDAATASVPITQAWLRALHETLTAGQDTYDVLTEVGRQEQPLPRGQYKTRPNHVRQADGTLHAYAPVDRTEPEMQRLVEQLRNDEFLALHPVLQAGYAHHALAAIHPFADGNGRTARALASVFLLRAVGVPLVLLADQRGSYLSALSRADAGDRQAFVDFTLDTALDSLALVTETLREASAASVRDQAERLGRALTSHGGLSPQEHNAIALRVLRHVERELESLTAEATLPADAHLEVSRFSQEETRHAPDPVYVPAGEGSAVRTDIRLRAGIGPPLRRSVLRTLHVSVARDQHSGLPFAVTEDQTGKRIRLRLVDVHPSLRPTVERRLRGWLEDRVADALGELAANVEGG